MTEEELQAIERSHVRDKAYPDGRYCAACGPAYGRWPCDAISLLAEVRRLRAFIRKWEPDDWHGGARYRNEAPFLTEP